MAEKVLVNLATGLEDAERVTVAFLVATAALNQGKEVVVWTTKDAVRLGLPGEAEGVACNGCPPLERLFAQFEEGGGQLWLCPICVSARDLDDAEKVGNSKIVGATPLWEWAGSDTTVFSY
ncbi:MAG: peroxiredoxin [Thermoleophilia bacterium]|nr:peroxiredoxin [Thermoleophilia bacterium]